MRRNLGVVLLLTATALAYQHTGFSQLERARKDYERVRGLVEAGALPRNALDEARLVLEEARDESVLEETLYGKLSLNDLTEEKIGSMISAAGRLLKRQQSELDKARKLVAEGVLPRSRLAPYQSELARRRLVVEQASARAGLFRELVAMARREQELNRVLETSPDDVPKIAEKFDGNGIFLTSQFRLLELEFQRKFQRVLPVSANGATVLHRSLGFDHRGRVDVALYPDSPEGRWLEQRLRALQIPYFAFRAAVPGKATGAHIHIGEASPRIRSAN